MERGRLPKRCAQETPVINHDKGLWKILHNAHLFLRQSLYHNLPVTGR